MNLERLRPPNPFEFLPAVPDLEIRSDSIDADGRLAIEHHGSQEGAGVSPHISWEAGPEGTESYAVTMLDIDAPTPGGVYHWVVVNIPKEVRELSIGSEDIGQVLLNDIGQAAYVGAAPPPGDWEHRYLITVWALSAPSLDLEAPTPASLTGFHLTMSSVGRGTLHAVV